MRNKKKKANLFLLLILSLAGFFGFENFCLADDNLIISEILVGGEKTDEEFIEIYNPTANSINLETLPLKLHTINSGGTDTNKNLTFNNNIIPANGYFVISSKEYKEKFNDIVDAFYGGGVLAKGWSIYISKNQEKSTGVLDIIKWEECKKNYSYSFNGTDWKCTSFSTPGKENEFDKIPETMVYSDKIIINEILPNPINKNDEYIELYNSEKSDADLGNWILRDSSKTGKFVFPNDLSIKSGDYLVVYKKDYKFSLNNSGKETVYLYNPNEEIVSSVNYSGAKENVSYNFNGSAWRWSKFLTPGKENKFNQLPNSETKNDKNIYVGVYADFSAKTEDNYGDKLKFTWDFGDGHKSYLKKTRHKYEKAGKYTATLKIFDGSEEKIETFSIEVKKFPAAKVKIISLSPNPSGKDSDFEWVEIENKSKSKINLKGWSVATGWKKLYNHPIAGDFVIEKGGSKKLTRDLCKFTLNNKKNKIELRYPNGKVAHKIKYKKENGISDDEIYEKTEGGWQWLKSQSSAENTQNNAEELLNTVEVLQNSEGETDEEYFSEFLGGQSEDLPEKEKQEELLNYGTQVKLAAAVYSGEGRVLGASTENYNEPVYRFSESAPTEHYAVKFFKNVFSEINYLLNKLIGGFFQRKTA